MMRKNSNIYLIFCENDYFGRNRLLDWVVSREEETGLAFNDGLYMVYVNGQYKDDLEIGRLMQELNH